MTARNWGYGKTAKGNFCGDDETVLYHDWGSDYKALSYFRTRGAINYKEFCEMKIQKYILIPN